MPSYIEKSRHGLYYLRLPQRLAHLNHGKRISLHTHSKRLAIQRAARHISSLDICLSLKVNEAIPATAAEYEALRQSLELDFKKENDQLDLVLKKAAPLPASSAVVRLALERRLRNVLAAEAAAYVTQQLESTALTPGATPKQQLDILNSLLNFAENLELDFPSVRQADGTISGSALEGARNLFKAEIFSQHEVLAERLSRFASQHSEAKSNQTLAPVISPNNELPSLTLYELHLLQTTDAAELEGESTPATLQEYDRYARVLTIMSGRQPIQEFTKQTFDFLHRQTRKIERGAIRKARFESSTLADLVPPESKKYEQISPETASSYSLRLAAIHKFAFKRGYTTVHPELIEKPRFEKISNRERKSTSLDDTKSSSFQTHELQAIFDGYLYRPKPLNARKEVHPFHFWFPLIALYSGMRINEISGLTTQAVEESKEGIWHFKVEEDQQNNRRIKSIASKRRVPVHRHLIQLGFIEYVSNRKRVKHKMLFDGLHFNERNGWGNTATRFFTRVPSPSSPGTGYFHDIGIHLVAHDGRDFHAFRHTLIDKLRACGVDNDYDIEAITGHEKLNVSEADRYGDGPLLTGKAEKLNRVSYAELELAHISYKGFTSYYKAALLRSARSFEKELSKEKAGTKE